MSDTGSENSVAKVSFVSEVEGHAEDVMNEIKILLEEAGHFVEEEAGKLIVTLSEI